MKKTNILKCKPPEVHFTIRNRVPYNKQLTNGACSGLTWEYWPSVVFVRTLLRAVRTVTTLGQYSPVRPSRSVSKRLRLSFLLEIMNTSLLKKWSISFGCILSLIKIELKDFCKLSSQIQPSCYKIPKFRDSNIKRNFLPVLF